MPRPMTVLCIVASVSLSACATPPPPPASPQTLPVFKTRAVLEPGCLLPRPGLLNRAPRSSAVLQLQVDELGQVSRADIAASSGDPEVDAALAVAANKCRFTPAYNTGGSPATRTNVPDAYSLSITWPAADAMVGPARCIRPEYPYAARRADEAGMVSVQFRRRSDTDEIEAHLVGGNNHLRILRPLTLRAVTLCLAHPEVRESIEVDRWIRVAYDWRLEP